jgi:transcriptional regulator with XRE-family HTH domain
MPARLSVLAVKRTRILAANGVEPEQIARDFGFDEAEVKDAIRGVTYSFINNPPPVCERPDEITGLGGARLSGVMLDGMRLRSIRESRLQLSQEALARRIQRVGHELGLPNHCSKRLVQKWEHGDHAQPTLGYRILLVEVTGVTDFEALCKPIESPSAEEVLRRLASLVPVFPAVYRELTGSVGQLGGSIPAQTSGLAATKGGDDGRSVVGASSRSPSSGRRPAEPRRPMASGD